MPARTIAIGDVHGCAAAMRAVIAAIAPTHDDTLVILGDCVDRGPDSAGVIEQVLALREKCRVVPLLGNHEEMMLNFLDGRPQPDDWLECGGAETIASYPREVAEQLKVSPEHEQFVRAWGDCFKTEAHFFVHGSYESDRPLEQQHWQTMRWQSLKFGIPEPHLSGKTAIVGHSSQKSGEILDVGHLVCIDTFCFGGGWLTALEPVTGRIWQADRDGRLRQK